MAKNLKPKPKSQKEISDSLVKPYVNPENGQSLGNPNTPDNFEQITKTDQTGIGFNRSLKNTFRGDDTKPLTIGLKDIDESILFYFNNVIRPTVTQNGNKIKVPVIYGSPERWKSAQIDGYYKDKNGKIMAPLIMFKRESFENDNSLSTKLDANNPHLYTSWQKKYYNKNSYSNFNLLNNRVPTKQFIANVIPDYVTLTYKCAVQTYYLEQLNKIVEAINYTQNSYWGDPERFKFKATIDSFSIVTEVTSNQNRLVKSEFTIKLKGYIIPDSIQREINSIKKYTDRSQIIIGIEETNSVAEPPTSNPELASIPTFIDAPTFDPNPQIDPEMLTYLNTNIQKLGTFVNATTITFPSGWLAAPIGLPPTSADSFLVFCNGILIEKAAILSFTELSGVTTLVIDPVELGYDFSNTDEVIAVGKFSS